MKAITRTYSFDKPTHSINIREGMFGHHQDCGGEVFVASRLEKGGGEDLLCMRCNALSGDKGFAVAPSPELAARIERDRFGIGGRN